MQRECREVCDRERQPASSLLCGATAFLCNKGFLDNSDNAVFPCTTGEKPCEGKGKQKCRTQRTQKLSREQGNDTLSFVLHRAHVIAGNMSPVASHGVQEEQEQQLQGLKRSCPEEAACSSKSHWLSSVIRPGTLRHYHIKTSLHTPTQAAKKKKVSTRRKREKTKSPPEEYNMHIVIVLHPTVQTHTQETARERRRRQRER